MNPNFLKPKYLTVLGAVLGLAVFSQVEASAQNAGSINIKKNQLQQAGWHKSPLQVQILDDGPVIKDYRTAPASDQGYNIPLAPTGNNGGRIPEGGLPFNTGSGPVTPRIQTPNLPQAGFGSNIPARGMGPATALPGVKMGGLGNQYAQQQQSKSTVAARPVGLGKPASGMRAAAAPASYGSSYGGSGGGGGYYGGGGSSSSTAVRAKLLGK